MLLLTAKNFAIVFGLATTAFCVSTIVLAVQKAELNDELQDALDKLDLLSTTAAPTTPTTQLTTESENSTNTASTTTTSIPTPPTASSTSSPASTVTVPTPPVVTDSTQTTRTTLPVVVPTITVTSTAATPVTSNPNYPTLPTGLPDPENITYRLPTEIRPIKYRIYWYPNFETNTCEGYVTVQIEVDVQTNLIVMHAKDLEIGSISILNVMAYLRIRVKSKYLSPDRELLIIELEELLSTATPYVVSMDFTCQLDGLNGMYSSVYNDEENAQRYNSIRLEASDIGKFAQE